MTDKPTIHQSDINQMARCQVQFGFRKGETFGIGPADIIPSPGVAAITGTATHATVERNMQTVMTKGELMQPGDITDMARDEMTGLWVDGEVLLTDDEAANISRTRGESIDHAIALSALHSIEVAPTLQPKGVEEPFLIKMPTYEFDLAGKKDIVEVSGNLHDTKTTGQAPPADKVINVQNSMYAMDEYVAHGRLPDLVTNDFLVKGRKRKSGEFGPATFKPLSAVPTLGWVDGLTARVERMIKIITAVREGKMPLQPADPGHWACTKRYCPFADRCEFWSGRE